MITRATLLPHRQQKVALSIWCLAALGCALGAVHISSASAPSYPVQLVDLVRIVATTALAFVLVFGPGLLLRMYAPRRFALGYTPLPGFALMILTGIIAWGLGRLGFVHPRVVSAVILVPSLFLMLAAYLASGLRSDPPDLLNREECWALGVVALALGVAIARSLWSLSPPGELYAFQIYRTLEVGGRPDSRISFHTVQLISYGSSPFGSIAQSYFLPYSFSSRGPLAALGILPVVMLTGGHPPLVIGTPNWLPFDPEGFMAYRLTMMTLCAGSFLSAWSLTRRLAGPRAARFVVVLAATTPFLVHELWYTWPKLLAASMLLLAALALFDERPLLCGALVGIGYLVHPLALLSLPFLLLLALWPLRGAQLRRPNILRALRVVPGPVIAFVVWRVFNGSHYDQSGFLSYVKQANPLPPNVTTVSVSHWLSDRLISLANTVVPLRLVFLSSQEPSLNSIYGPSPGIVHFFFQYWNTLPFGIGITFFPLLLLDLWKALKRWPWAVICVVLLPLLEFVIYWGAGDVGLLPEGLHPWILTLLVVVTVYEHRTGYRLLANPVTRVMLCLRAFELFLVAVLPTLATIHRIYSPHYVLTDLVAMVALILLCGSLARLVWRERVAGSLSAIGVAA